MLAGLIFATEDAESHGEGLAATLPFGGMTLVEYQARLLIAAGVTHLLVAVSRVTPALLGSVARVERRGITVDVVRSAEEAAAKAHPLADVIVIADALVTTDTVVTAMAGERADTILVTSDDAGNAAIERIDAEHHWAGVARLSSRHLTSIAAMPREYDFQSTLLRVAVQNAAEQVLLPAAARRAGHGVERHAAALASRSNAVLAALANQRTGWADRFVFTPLTRRVLPALVARSVPDAALAASGLLLFGGALALIGVGRGAMAAAPWLLAVVTLSTGSLLSWLRGNERMAAAQEWLSDGGVALTFLGIGGAALIADGHPTGLTLAVAAVAAAVIATRVPGRRGVWHADAAAFTLVAVPLVVAGYPLVALAVAAVYALVSLGLAVEGSRPQA